MLASGLGDTISSGPFVLAALLSVAAGAVSFASPCVVPLVPGYLSYLVGLVGSENAAGTSDSSSASTKSSGTVQTRKVTTARAVRATVFFVLGFTAVFLAQSVLVLGISSTLSGNLDLLTRIGGGITIVMGLVMLGFIKPLQREARLHVRPRGRILGAPLLGVVFGLGWVTCLGPTLIAVLSLANATDWNGNAWRGLFLVLFYCLGLGVPFVLLAFGFSWAASALSFMKRNSRTIQVVGGLLLICLGVLMVTGLWGQFIASLRGVVSGDGGVLL
ncbi:cytochrome c biogenesis protein CcdA [Nakamurella antarctica]|uniref:Cytochrome c biogenesis protein CcdA n=1 Tax=Nakamurella antarctica TaxID=1902245 RepID=A0A3G8ZS17_9ACTN|nr:cytochrome c biogenesis CcdA family protein [Nakamurella antarctica]AZI59595.1 cytochrome c biogenesis protein CcdA [Nakamurella antarctica]